MRRSVAVVLLFLAACDPPAAPTPPPVSNSPAQDAPLAPGTIEGVVIVDSDDVAALTAPVRGFERYCGDGPLDTKLYQVDPKTKGLGGAFVEADGRCREFASKDPALLDQKACLFTPVMLVMPPGPVVFKNSDGMAHNVSIDAALNPDVKEGFPGGESISRTFRFEEKLTVKCSIHPWMMAGIVVTGRAAHAVTDAGGRFRIEGVEAGRRTLKAWHPLGDEVKIEVYVPANGKVGVEIRWKPRAAFRAPFGR